MSALAPLRASAPCGLWLPRPTVFAFTTPGSLPPGATLTRASAGWYVDAGGVLQSAVTDAARWTYDPSSGAMLGLLNEPAATNALRNGTGTGAASGSPGTQPTNWSLTGNGGSFNGLTRTINGSVTEDGLSGLSVTYAGTPTASGSITIQTDGMTQIPAAQGQSWVGSAHMRLLAGSLPQPVTLILSERDGGGANLGSVSVPITPTTAAARTQRFDTARTMASASTAYAAFSFGHAYTNGIAENFTLFLANVQLAQGAVPTSLIPTASTAVARAGDALALALANGTYQIALTRASGTTLAKATVIGGSYTVPQDPSPLQRVTAWRLK